MLKFYNFQNLQSITANLTWGHWIELLSIKDVNKLKYYIKQCEKLLLTTRQLRERIKNKEYERLDSITRDKLIAKEETTVEDFIKNLIVIGCTWVLMNGQFPAIRTMLGMYLV